MIDLRMASVGTHSRVVHAAGFIGLGTLCGRPTESVSGAVGFDLYAQANPGLVCKECLRAFRKGDR